jgi:hypothetical protein
MAWRRFVFRGGRWIQDGCEFDIHLPMVHVFPAHKTDHSHNSIRSLKATHANMAPDAVCFDFLANLQRNSRSEGFSKGIVAIGTECE